MRAPGSVMGTFSRYEVFRFVCFLKKKQESVANMWSGCFFSWIYFLAGSRPGWYKKPPSRYDVSRAVVLWLPPALVFLFDVFATCQTPFATYRMTRISMAPARTKLQTALGCPSPRTSFRSPPSRSHPPRLSEFRGSLASLPEDVTTFHICRSAAYFLHTSGGDFSFPGFVISN
jgi:hypothetical protein